jgi:hypothetical protein
MLSKRAVIGIALCRVIVPLWVLAGAVFKLYERTPSNLPSGIVSTAKGAGVDLETLMRLLIGLEFFAVGVMVLLPRFARAMAIFMLSCFVVIILWELARQATKCGCFGSLPVKPWHMLLVDGTLLAGVIIFNSRAKKTATTDAAPRRSPAPAIAAMAALLTLGLAISFAVPNPPPKVQPVIDQIGSTALPDDPSTTGVTPPTDPAINPRPQPLPNSWYTRDMESWVGKPWRELEIFQLMPRWPKDMDTGKRYVVFYSRTCEHCQAMFQHDLVIPLDAPVTAVEIPQSRDVVTAPDAWPMPSLAHVELLTLPLGCSWIITPPLAVTVVDGKVTCANEGDHKACMDVP